MIKPFGIFVVVIGAALAGRSAVAAMCPAGQWLTGGGQCVACNVSGTGALVSPVYNTYCPGDDIQHKCKDERPNSENYPINAIYTSLDDCLCSYGYEFGTDMQCHACPAGTYKSVINNTTKCTTVPAGAYACGDPCWDDSCYKDSAAASTCTCDRGSYCPGGASRPIDCPNGTTTSGTGAKSASECNVCSAGYGYYNGQCTLCPAGTYKSSSGATTCTNCTNKPANSSYVGTGATANACPFTCNNGYYGATNATSGSCNACGNGYWCAGGVRNACGANMTTTTNKATSASDCVCLDGYEMVDGVCVELPKQTPCNAGVSVLHAGDYTYSLWTECDSPALWIGTDNGNCCVNLVPGIQNGALNIDYLGTIYHAVNQK